MKNIFRKHKAAKWAKITKPANIPKPIYRSWGLAARLENKAIRIKGKRNK